MISRWEPSVNTIVVPHELKSKKIEIWLRIKLPNQAFTDTRDKKNPVNIQRTTNTRAVAYILEKLSRSSCWLVSAYCNLHGRQRHGYFDEASCAKRNCPWTAIVVMMKVINHVEPSRFGITVNAAHGISSLDDWKEQQQDDTNDYFWHSLPGESKQPMTQMTVSVICPWKSYMDERVKNV